MKKYCQLLEKVPGINKYFKTSFLPVAGEDFKLLKLEKIVSSEYPLLIIMAGCHGEEPAPSLFLFRKYRLIAQKAVLAKVNLLIYPLVNPYGFDRYIRDNRENLNCNHNWIHFKKKPLAAEAEAIKKDLSKYQPKIFISLHEDDLTKNEFYLFSFGNRKFEQILLDAGKNIFRF